MPISEKRRYCLVCGFNFKRRIYPEDDCQCCGAIQGYFSETSGPEHIQEYRQYWFDEKNTAWADGEEYQPEAWNKEMALKQIKDNVPEEFQ